MSRPACVEGVAAPSEHSGAASTPTLSCTRVSVSAARRRLLATAASAAGALAAVASCSSNTEPATTNGALASSATMSTEATPVDSVANPATTTSNPGNTSSALPASGTGSEAASSSAATSVTLTTTASSTPATSANDASQSFEAPATEGSEAPPGNTGTAVIDSSEAVSSGQVEDTVDEDGDLVPPRALDVTAAKGRHEHRFRAKDADATVSYNDNDEIAIFDNRAATLMGKLVLTFGGAGETKGNLTGGGEFCAKRGFHVLAVAAFQAYNIVDYGPDFFGDARRTVFEGVMHTKQDAFANITLTPADGVAQRTQKALQYLHATYPDEDWGYYLQADGSVRWSDVIFTGVSHGASNSARFASLVRASRVVAVAGPRDNLCARVDLNDCGGEVATWYDEVPKTPIERYYTITGTQDDQHTQHLFAMEKLGYLGEPTRVDNAQPPYDNSHRLVHGGGHDDVCANQSFADLCNYAFGVPAENHAGTP